MLALEGELCGDRTAQVQNQVALKNEWHSTLGPVPASAGVSSMTVSNWACRGDYGHLFHLDSYV